MSSTDEPGGGPAFDLAAVQAMVDAVLAGSSPADLPAVVRQLIDIAAGEDGFNKTAARDLVLFLDGPNGRLPDGARPIDLLTSAPEKVIDAARHEFDEDAW